ncbi:PREDICTED: nucleolar pre-ribosomal-associated protein 1 [Papilio xuthus]|uniref:Nucleolar pre-ribosomal-associated protein 1 n=1 Tax=Papilio xuthus TaxID=66420 RepID=A0AAJ7EI91_PAPXU|nr:PREDICTED: nucleolar pre-ribosomal-associated protein 1 [Papilio xuthus]
MGKRKYDNTETDPAKKIKPDDIENNDEIESKQPQSDETSQIKKSLQKHSFDMKHFRKELASKQGQTMVLTQFLNVCLNPDNEVDYILEYLKIGGNSHEILRQITQDNKKNLTLATPAFHLFHLIIVKVQSSLPHMITITEEACRYFLNTFIPTVEIMISENSGPRHRKIILNLLTSMVTLNSDLGVEILNQLPLTPKHLQYILEKPNYKEKDNVRTAFVHFMTSFLIEGHLPLIKALLEKQGLLGLVIPGLVHDEAEAVLIFLNILKKNIIDNTYISKTLKLKTFNQQVLYNMFKVFSWKGPPEMNSELRNKLRPEITNLLSEIMVTLFTSHRLGLYFIDNSLGTTDVNKNPNLYKALLSLKRPWENENECDVILQIIHKCPDLHRAIISVVEQSFQPQHSPIWERTIEFTIKLIEKLKPEDVVHKMKNLTPLQTANFIRFVTLPVPLLKHIQPNIGQDRTISLYCAKVLVKMLQMLKRYIQILESVDNQSLIIELKNKLEYFFPKHLPPPSTIVLLIQNVMNVSNNSVESSQDYSIPKPDDADSLLVLVELLLLYNFIHPAFFESLEGNIDIRSILDYSMNISSNTSLLKFKIVSLWLMLDSSAVSTKNPMFKDLFRIMLDVYTNDTDDTWLQTKDTLHIFFKNTNIFEDDEDEIHIVLYALRKVKVNPISLIGDIVEYAIKNKKELTTLVRNQINSLEISDANKDENLDALFNGLMKNKCNDDNIFMDNKTPSPFVIACIQYTMPNKDAKKSLKQFLSLYIANLLHSNYSPELTEILMGDSKVDVRNYVASWMGEPITLTDVVVGKDNVLCNLSKSIIANEDLTIEQIFTFLEKSSDEEKDIEIAGCLKIVKAVNNSELLIWSRYLIFCFVKLTQINRFTEVEEDKIKRYIDCLIEICKKQHTGQVCRDIILNMFKNTHVLKIYTPIEQKRNESDVIATKLLLHVLTKHSEIVNYLNKKKNILLPYQMKNFKEVMNILKKIKKKKYIKSQHTVKILEEVGLRKKDDMLIMNYIFNADLNTCVSDEKEPSLSLEILCVIITKYSKTIKLDLPQDVLLKSLKMYCQLLKSLEININLTSMEEALICYFENKPQYVSCVSEDIFRSFFQSNTVRKSTSQLAYTLLKFDEKLCKIFKEEIDRPQILSQRELTLPLGNAVLNHKIFLSNNKEFLSKIYEEYKSNINKYLEKPHKAGQIYLTNWNFIKKLIIECMDIQDCKKILTKTYKFEVIDIGHINLYQSVFLKICLQNEDTKKDYLINYYLSLLHLLTTAIKENIEVRIVHTIVHNILQVTQISGFDIEQKQDFAKITDNSIWQNFCKAVLKASLRIKTANESMESGSKLLCLLTKLIKLFYSKDHEDIITLFDMVTSHSEFLNVMLSHHSLEIKSRLVENLFALISINKSVMKPQQIPVYLSAYGATTGSCDKIILSILHYYESNGLPVNEYKPYVWGDSAANYYAVRKSRTSSLWGHPTPNQVLNLFDKDIIQKTVRNFPVNQKLDYNYELPEYNEIGVLNKKESFKTVSNEVFNEYNIKQNDNESAIKCLLEKSRFETIMLKFKENDITDFSHIDADEEIYDPVFVFSLLSHLLAPGSVASCFKLLRTGLLSVPVMALSSHCPMMRSAAYHVLHRFCMLLETETKHKNDKLFLGDFITTLRMSLSTAITDSANEIDGQNPRLPAVGALYLAKALMVSTAPFDPLYKPVNNFFIAKQIVDLTNVPDFLSLFHDSDVESVDRRQWILDVIKDGTKTMTDVNVVFKSMCLKMIMDFYSTELCDRKTKEKIVSALNSIITVPKAFDILIKGYGFLSWLHYAVRQIRKDEKCVVIQMFDLIKNMFYSLRIDSLLKFSLTNNVNGKIDAMSNLKVDKEIEFKILLILIDLSNYLEGLELTELYEYVGTYKFVSKKTIKLLTKKQILNVINKCIPLLNVDESVDLLSKAVVNGARILKSNKIINLEDISMDNCIIKELTILVQTYLT